MENKIFKVSSKPRYWSSRLGSDGREKVEYPYILQVLDTEHDIKVSIRDQNGYGWDLEELENVSTPVKVLKLGDRVELLEELYIVKDDGGYFLKNIKSVSLNDLIFTQLNIDKDAFYTKTLNKQHWKNGGIFPFTKTLEDLTVLVENLKLEIMKKQNTAAATVLKDRVISPSQAQSIIDIACSRWKDTLFDRWGKCIVLREDIHISEEFYQEMRQACSTEQHKLFDNIFGKEESITIKLVGEGYEINKIPALEIRADAEYADKGFYLSNNFEWKFVKDSEGSLVLVPKAK